MMKPSLSSSPSGTPPARRVRTFFLISAAGIIILIFLAISGILAANLMANRDQVRLFLTTKARQAFNTDLDYARLDLCFFPVPHLEAFDPRLYRADGFDLRARRLSLYPALLPILSGNFQVRRLILVDPDIQAQFTSDPSAAGHSTSDHAALPASEKKSAAAISDLFAFLASIDPGTQFYVQNGRFQFFSEKTVAWQASAIHMNASHTGNRLSLKITGTSPLTGEFQMNATAPAELGRIQGEITVSAIDVQTLFSRFPISDEIRIKGKPASARLAFAINHPDRLLSRFSLDLPELTVLHGSHSLPVDRIALSGTAGYMETEWLFSVDALTARTPEIALSGAARLRTGADTDQSLLDLRASAKALEIETAHVIARAFSGNSPEISTAFSVARSGLFTDLQVAAEFEQTDSNWTVKTLSAAGHLSGGTITLPGIETDLTEMEGDVAYTDTRVAFTKMRGAFQGVRFSALTAGIDWTGDATLFLETSAAEVDTAVFFPWLTRFEELSGATAWIAAMSGKAALPLLKINGPLTEPEKWQLAIRAIPDTLHLYSPHAPFPVILHGGEISYRPGMEQSRKVGVRFLDAAVTVSHESRGVVPPESISCQMDGSLGHAATDWLSQLLSLPPSLFIQSPVALSGVSVQWDGKDAVSLSGILKTPGPVELSGDMHLTRNAWQVRKLQVSDPDSTALISAHRHGQALTLAFSGNIDKKTMDRLFRQNDILSGKMAGQFTMHLYMDAPALSSFSGTLSGSGLFLGGIRPLPVEANRFSFSGNGSRMTVADTDFRINGVNVQVSGDMFRQNGKPQFDLSLNMETLDADWMRNLFLSEKKPSDGGGITEAQKPDFLASPGGTIRLRANQLREKRFIISPLEAIITVASGDIQTQLKTAVLCGISVTGAVNFTCQGVSLKLSLSAENAGMNETLTCLLEHAPVVMDARYQLSGKLSMPPTQTDFLHALTGTFTLRSENGRIVHDHVLMKILSILNITELLTGGKTDLNQKGYGYTLSQTRASLSGGKLRLTEMLLDGNALKITGEGTLNLDENTADIYILAAPMKTIDRIVSYIPGLNYLSGGSLISIPMRAHGPVNDLAVVPLSPSAIGKSLYNAMNRVLNAPFRLVEYIMPKQSAPETDSE